MELSLFLAKLLGLYMLIIAAIWLLRKPIFESEVRDILSSKGVFPITAAINILVGLCIAIAHPIWTFNWQGLITLIGYLSIIQGVLRLAFPSEARDMLNKFFAKASWIWLLAFIVIGLFLTYHGFNTAHDHPSMFKLW